MSEELVYVEPPGLPALSHEDWIPWIQQDTTQFFRVSSFEVNALLPDAVKTWFKAKAVDYNGFYLTKLEKLRAKEAKYGKPPPPRPKPKHYSRENKFMLRLILQEEAAEEGLMPGEAEVVDEEEEPRSPKLSTHNQFLELHHRASCVLGPFQSWKNMKVRIRRKKVNGGASCEYEFGPMDGFGDAVEWVSFLSCATLSPKNSRRSMKGRLAGDVMEKMDKNEDGKLTLDELLDEEGFTEIDNSQIKKEVIAGFAIADLNNDGFIDASEMPGMLAQIKGGEEEM